MKSPSTDLERALGDVLVRPVDRVARLEADDRLPAPLREGGARSLRRQDVVPELVRVLRKVHSAHRTRHAAGSLGHQGRDAGVRRIRRAVDVARLLLEVALEGLLDGQNAQETPVGAVQRQLVAVRGVHAGRERDGDAPWQTVGEAHLVHDALPVVGALEAAQRAEPAHRQQLQVRGLAGAEVDRLQSAGPLHQSVALLAAREQVNQRSSVRFDHLLATPCRPRGD